MKKKANKRVLINSVIALGFAALMYFVDWIFIIGAVIMIYLNQRELMGGRNVSHKKALEK
jgi:hypothetical protein